MQLLPTSSFWNDADEENETGLNTHSDSIAEKALQWTSKNNL